MSIEDDLPQYVDLLTERYGRSIVTIAENLAAQQADENLAALIAAGNHLANIVAKRCDFKVLSRTALERWDQARDRFPEIDP